MKALGYALVVAGGGWCALWGLEVLFVRANIFQSFGDHRTEEARRDSARRGKAHQQRMINVLGRGMVVALPIAVLGFMLLVLG
jgi:hypothetical protein